MGKAKEKREALRRPYLSPELWAGLEARMVPWPHRRRGRPRGPRPQRDHGPAGWMVRSRRHLPSQALRCPRCGTPMRFVRPASACACLDCGFRLALTAAEVQTLLAARAWTSEDPVPSVPALLAEWALARLGLPLIGEPQETNDVKRET